MSKMLFARFQSGFFAASARTRLNDEFATSISSRLRPSFKIPAGILALNGAHQMSATFFVYIYARAVAGVAYVYGVFRAGAGERKFGGVSGESPEALRGFPAELRPAFELPSLYLRGQFLPASVRHGAQEVYSPFPFYRDFCGGSRKGAGLWGFFFRFRQKAGFARGEGELEFPAGLREPHAFARERAVICVIAAPV